jgi:hypothetical protein
VGQLLQSSYAKGHVHETRVVLFPHGAEATCSGRKELEIEVLGREPLGQEIAEIVIEVVTGASQSADESPEGILIDRGRR